MLISTEYFIGLLRLIQGLHFSDAYFNDPCVAKILSCDWYRKSFSFYGEKGIGMFTNIEDLNKACKEQAPFKRCIIRAKKFCEQGILLPIAEEMIKNRRFPTEICRHASPWQQLYLKEANCLNAYSRKAFAHCMVKIGCNSNPDDILVQKCEYMNAIVECSSKAMRQKCGYYAGNILKRFIYFHTLTEYQCLGSKPADVEDYSLSFTPDYDTTESIFKAADFNNEATEGIYGENVDFEQTKLDDFDYPISLTSQDPFTIFDIDHPVTEESLMTTEYSFFDSLDYDTDSKDGIVETDNFQFPALPKHHYIHNNRTTFAMYEDLEMGHMKYVGCGEADVFWVILSPLRSKYCILTDLKSEFSEAIFKCTVRIDAPCSPESDYEDRRKGAEVVVFHHRYIVTVLTPPNNQRSEDMAIMNAHYLKFYPSPSTHVPEKEVNLWTDQANKANIKETEPIGRKGPLELDDRYDVSYQHCNVSGQKWDRLTTMKPPHLDEYFESENLDYYPEEEEDEYFPESLSNNIIYIEDNKGGIISLHDHRSPIYSKYSYEPHSLFRPRIGTMSELTDTHIEEVGTNSEKILAQRSDFKGEISEFQEAPASEIKPDQREFCSAETPCSPNSKFISEFGIKPGMHILSRNIETFDPLKEMKRLKKIPSITKLNDLNEKPHLRSGEVYVVTPSAEIEFFEPEMSIQTELYKDKFVTGRSKYSLKE